MASRCHKLSDYISCNSFGWIIYFTTSLLYFNGLLYLRLLKNSILSFVLLQLRRMVLTVDIFIHSLLEISTLDMNGITASIIREWFVMYTTIISCFLVIGFLKKLPSGSVSFRIRRLSEIDWPLARNYSYHPSWYSFVQIPLFLHKET